MACDAQRLNGLPIRPQYKQGLMQMCSDPANAEQCEQLCQMSDEEIVQNIGQIEKQVLQWTQEGAPPELDQALAGQESQGAPLQQGPPTGPPPQGIESLPQGPAPAPGGQIPPGIPPGQLADTPMPMDIPNQGPQGYANGGMIPRYGLGGFIKKIGKELGRNNGLLGSVVGAALAPYGGLTLAMGAAYGGAAATAIQGGNLRDVISSGLQGYGLGSIYSGVTNNTTGLFHGGEQANLANTGGVNLNDWEGTKWGGTTPEAIHDMDNIAFASKSGPGNVGTAAAVDSGVTAPDPGKSNWWDKVTEDPMRALGTTAIIGGLMEDPQYETVNSPPAGPSEFQQYQECVAKNGAENCTMPTSLYQPERQYTHQPAQPMQQSLLGEARPQHNPTGLIQGPGPEQGDQIPAFVSPNEFMLTADAVRGAGDGNLDIGADRLYQLMDELENRGRR